MPSNAAEEIVQTCLLRMKHAGQINYFIRNNRNDRLDCEGIDFLIFLINGLALPLQVKTFVGERKNEEKRRTHERIHPAVEHIIFINIHGEDADGREEEYRRIIRTIRSAVKESLRRRAV